MAIIMLYKATFIKGECKGSNEQWVQTGPLEVVEGRRWHLLHVHMPGSGSFASNDLLGY